MRMKNRFINKRWQINAESNRNKCILKTTIYHDPVQIARQQAIANKHTGTTRFRGSKGAKCVSKKLHHQMISHIYQMQQKQKNQFCCSVSINAYLRSGSKQAVPWQYHLLEI
jgi:hypothetical protein